MSQLTRCEKGSVLRATSIATGTHCGTNASISGRWIPEVQLPCHLQTPVSLNLFVAVPRDSPLPISPALSKVWFLAGNPSSRAPYRTVIRNSPFASLLDLELTN
ncbi:hypothetical protein BDDG_11774 [Blastomyces dermatitidis ATCC 18188]|uniref:Uncharacterized protein n=1 Tax=Ajellomyces dermatitidis (strain ATCC 18188 / CBS 674.68) TaxID=653446 RepID=A0A0J9ENP4_AJEDA|nr:hypothetical protein BDDG_11774 [Blastomyces dermatitidis ATCC 18188]